MTVPTRIQRNVSGLETLNVAASAIANTVPGRAQGSATSASIGPRNCPPPPPPPPAPPRPTGTPPAVPRRNPARGTPAARHSLFTRRHTPPPSAHVRLDIAILRTG